MFKKEYSYYCYIRANSQPDVDRQKRKLCNWCIKQHIDYNQIEITEEVRTGTNVDRPKFLRLMEALKYERSKHDTCLILVENARLGRSYKGNVQMLQDLKKHDIKLVVPGYPILDTRKETDVIDIMLNTYEWIAESESILNQNKVQIGRQDALEKGVKFGRPNLSKSSLPQEFLSLYQFYKREQIGVTKTTLLKVINDALVKAGKPIISRATLYNYIKICEEN